MDYEINVAKPVNLKWAAKTAGTIIYAHYFKVIVSYVSVKQVYEELCEAFPDCKIEVTAW